MKDLLFIIGKLTDFEKEVYLQSLYDKIESTLLKCDIVDISDLRVGLLNHYHGFIFVNVGKSDRIRRFVEKGKIFNKSFFYLKNSFKVGGDKNSLEISDIVDISLNIGNDNNYYDSENSFHLDYSYSEKLLESLWNKKMFLEGQRLIIFSKSTEALLKYESYIDQFLKSSKNNTVSLVCEEQFSKKLFKRRSRINILNFENIYDVIGAIYGSKVAIIDENQSIEHLERVKDLLAIGQIPVLKIDNETTDVVLTTTFSFSDSSEQSNLSKQLIANRYKVVHEKGAIYKSIGLYEFIIKNMNPSVVFSIPGTVVRGGIHVAMKHAKFLMQRNYEVTLLSDRLGDNEQNVTIEGVELPVVAQPKEKIQSSFDKLICTLWSTVKFVSNYAKAKEKYYLVQGYETDFSEPNHPYRTQANETYYYENIKYVTISQWCKEWLETDYHRKNVRYAPNGINLEQFKFHVRKPLEKRKFKILIEGNPEEFFRGIDESFTITNGLDPDLFEIHFLSYVKGLKEWYRVDKTYFTVPYSEVAMIYTNCDLLLKSSTLESFSYPPLEMMATGGISVIVQNDGNKIYAKNNENCLIYEKGDIEGGRSAIMKLYNDESLRAKLVENGLKTAQEYAWDHIEKSVVDLYKS